MTDWEAWRNDLTKILSGGDQWFMPSQGGEILNPARQYSDVPYGANHRLFNNPYLLFEHMRRTERILHDTSDGAMRSLQALEFEIIESSDNPEHLEHVEWLKKYLEKIPTEIGRGEGCLRQLLWDGVDYGSSYLSMPWEKQGYTLPRLIRSVPQWAIRYYYEGTTAVGYYDDRTVPPHGLVWTGDQAVSVRMQARDPWRPYGWGVIAACYRDLYVFNFAYSLALEGMERHDLPWIIANFPAGAREWADKLVDSNTRVAGVIYNEAPMTSAADVANPEALIDEQNMEYGIEFKELARPTHQIFLPWLNKIESSVSYAYTNQSLATQQSTGGEGSKAQASVHESSRGRSEAGWASLIEQGIQTIVNRIWKFNFWGEEPPTYHIVTEPEEAVDPQMVSVAIQLSNLKDDSGKPLISAAWLRDLVHAPEPAPGEALVEPTPVAPAIPGFTSRLSVSSDEILTQKARGIGKRIIGATSSYAVSVARRVMPSIREGLESLASVYCGPQTTKDEITNKLTPLQEALKKASETGDLRGAREHGIDLLPLADAITNTTASLWLTGRANEDLSIYNAVKAQTLTATRMRLSSSGDIQIQSEDAALAEYMQGLSSGKLHYPLTDQQWQLASAAIRRNGVKYASETGLRLSEDLNRALMQAVDDGITQEQFVERLTQKWLAAGITPASPAYLDMVLRTTSMQSYGQGQGALARSEAVDSILWGFQMICNLGLSPHHEGHEEMNLFAAPKDHPAWTDGWGPGCDYNCACMRIGIINRWAELQGWMGEWEPTVPYVGFPPELPQPVYGGAM